MATRSADDQPAAPIGPPAARRPRVRSQAVLAFAAGAALVLAGVLLYALVTPRPPQLTRADVNEQVARVLASATPAPAVSALIYAAISPSLVLIEARGENARDPESSSLGSGVVVTDQGDILTSLHVVEDAVEIQLTFADGSKSTGQIVAQDPDNDIAVVRPDEPPALLVPAILGDPNAVRIGDVAFAVGNPFGLRGSISAGVVSGLGRSFKRPDSPRTLSGLIQIDAAVNPGNSGGPLVNRDGQVIGIVAALVNPTTDEVFIGIGLAVPIDVAGGAAGLPPY